MKSLAIRGDPSGRGLFMGAEQYPPFVSFHGTRLPGSTYEPTRQSPMGKINVERDLEARLFDSGLQNR